MSGIKDKSAPLVEKLIHMIVLKHKTIGKVFVFLVVLSILCFLVVGVNYDLSKYLPSDSPSKQGIDLMKEEFEYPGSGQVMIEDVTLYEAKAYKEKIEAIPGVDSVTWADDVGHIYVGESFLEAEDIDDYYKDGYALMSITFVYGDSDTATYEAINEIKELLGEKGYLTGPAIENEGLSSTLNGEVSRLMVFVVIMIFLILTITTNSWIEPILFMFTMFIGIILNLGSNIIFGEISFLSFSIGAILQMAVSMDYSIFLFHSFTAEMNSGLEAEEAICNALREAVSSIVSSGMTTFIGFLVLALMQFTIGKDMGFVLAKGIICSMLTVLVLMPSLILRMNKYIVKTRHRPFIPSLEKPAKKVFQARYIIAVVIGIIIIPCYFAQNMNHFMYGTAVASGEGTRSYEDTEKIKKIFGEKNAVIIMMPNTSAVTEKRLADKLDDLPYTDGVTSLSEMLPAGVSESFLPESITSQLHTDKYARIIVNVISDSESTYAFQCVDEIKAMVQSYYPKDTYFVGTTPVTQDMKNSILADYNKVNGISILGVALVILFTFFSPAMTIVVIVPIEFAIFINMAVPYIKGSELAFLGFLMVSSMQLGATVDYSILLTNNYIDIREREADKKTAAERAILKSMLSIMTSGIILTVVGYGVKFMTSVSAIADMGLLLGRGAILSMVLVLGLLPLLLNIFDGLIMKDRENAGKLLRMLENKKRAYDKKICIAEKIEEDEREESNE